MRTVLTYPILAGFLVTGGDAFAETPAARMGDATAHGGVIVGGLPTVLIAGQPAARATDMTVCPGVTGVVPHVGGPIIQGSLTVLIGNMPAARVGDLVTEAGPPSAIVVGAPTVLIGP